jgi:hypothetical protein
MSGRRPRGQADSVRASKASKRDRRSKGGRGDATDRRLPANAFAFRSKVERRPNGARGPRRDDRGRLGDWYITQTTGCAVLYDDVVTRQQ